MPGSLALVQRPPLAAALLSAILFAPTVASAQQFANRTGRGTFIEAIAGENIYEEGPNGWDTANYTNPNFGLAYFQSSLNGNPWTARYVQVGNRTNNYLYHGAGPLTLDLNDRDHLIGPNNLSDPLFGVVATGDFYSATHSGDFASLTVTGGGTFGGLDAANRTFVGLRDSIGVFDGSVGSDGVLNVTGAGTTFQTGNAYVGGQSFGSDFTSTVDTNSQGTLTVSDGASFETSQGFFVGNNTPGPSSSAGTAGSVLIDGGALDVGQALDVQAGSDFTVAGGGTVVVGGASDFDFNSSLSVADGIATFDDLTLSNLSSADVGAAGTVDVSGSTGIGVGSTLTVQDGGLLISDGTLTNSGVFEVTGGTYQNDGAMGGVGTFTVTDGGTLAGNGSFTTSVYLGEGAILAPGNSAGELEFTDLDLDGGMTYEWEVGTLPSPGGEGVGWDFFDVSGTLQLLASGADPITLAIRSLGSLTAGDFTAGETYEWLIARAGVFDAGSFDPNAIQLDIGASLDGMGQWSIAAVDLGGGAGGLQAIYAADVAAVPEPGTWLLIGLSMLTGVLYRLRSGGWRRRLGQATAA